MAAGRLAKRTLDALLANGVTGFLWDEDLKGFGVKTSANGSASYLVQYRIGGRESKTRRYTIGGHGSPWTPAMAREEAARMLMLGRKVGITAPAKEGGQNHADGATDAGIIGKGTARLHRGAASNPSRRGHFQQNRTISCRWFASIA